MPRTGSGTYSQPVGNFSPNTTISSVSMNTWLDDIGTTLTASVAADGQTPNIGPLKGISGSGSTPTYTFSGDNSSGFYLVSAGNVGLAIAGANVATFSAGSFTYAGSTFSASGQVPTGAVMPFAGTSAPTGWLLCSGQVVSQTTFAALFAVVGSSYNTGGEGAGNFRVPDLRGRITAGIDNMGGTAASRLTATTISGGANTAGNSGGEQTHILAAGELAAHSHGITEPNSNQGHQHQYNEPKLGLISLTVGSPQSFYNTTDQIATQFATTQITINNNSPAGGAHNNVQPTMVMNYVIKT